MNLGAKNLNQIVWLKGLLDAETAVSKSLCVKFTVAIYEENVNLVTYNCVSTY